MLVAFAAGIAVFREYGTMLPPPVNVRPFTPEEIEHFQQQDKIRQEYIRDTIIADRVFEQNGIDPWLAERVAHYAVDTHLPVSVLAATVVVESSGRPGVVSSLGAVGLMQVRPKTWHMSPKELKDPDVNLRKGSAILSGYVREYGLKGGLHHYIGLGPTDGNMDGDSYTTRVMTIAGYRQ